MQRSSSTASLLAVVLSCGTLVGLTACSCRANGSTDNAPPADPTTPTTQASPQTGTANGPGVTRQALAIHHIRTDAQVGGGAARHAYVAKIIAQQREHLKKGLWPVLNGIYLRQVAVAKNEAIYNAVYGHFLFLTPPGEPRVDQAREYLDRALELDENFAYAHELRALIHLEKFRRDPQANAELVAAHKQIDTAIKLVPDFKEAFVLRANAYAMKSDWAHAQEAVEAALAIDERYEDGWTLLVQALVRQGDLDEAVARISEAPISTSAKARQLRALAERRTKENQFVFAYDHAKQAFRFAKQAGDALEQKWWIDLYQLLAQLAVLQPSPDFERAFGYLDRIFEVTLPRAAIELYERLARESRQPEALERTVTLWQRYIDATPLQPKIEAELKKRARRVQTLLPNPPRDVLLELLDENLALGQNAAVWPLLERLTGVRDIEAPSVPEDLAERLAADDQERWRAIVARLLPLCRDAEPRMFGQALPWSATLVRLKGFEAEHKAFLATARELLARPVEKYADRVKVSVCVAAARLGDPALAPDIVAMLAAVFATSNKKEVRRVFPPANRALKAITGKNPDPRLASGTRFTRLSRFGTNLARWQAAIKDLTP